MTPDTLAALSGALLSLSFAYIPGLSPWYAAQSAQIKKLIMAASLLLATGAVFGFGCAGWAGALGLPALECSKNGAGEAVRALLLALAVNQGVYKLAKPAPVGPFTARPYRPPMVDDGEGDGYTPR